MGWMDRLRAMFGGGGPAEPKPARTDAVGEELAEERVQHDIEHDREAAAERRIETPTTLDD